MLPMRQLKVLEPADFDRLLTWLDPDPDRAGQLYESIRWRLIAILASRGCHIPEELADDVIDRVARRVKDIEATYTGDKAIYFLGDRKSTRLNSSHGYISYAVFCLKKKIITLN